MESEDLPGMALAPGMYVEKEQRVNDEDPRHKHLKHGEERRPRHSAPGTPKKGGHGGKFTWEGPIHEDYNAEEDDVAQALDEHDPNYVDANEEALDAEAAVGYVDVPKVADQGVATVEVKLRPK